MLITGNLRRLQEHGTMEIVRARHVRVYVYCELKEGYHSCIYIIISWRNGAMKAKAQQPTADVTPTCWKIEAIGHSRAHILDDSWNSYYKSSNNLELKEIILS